VDDAQAARTLAHELAHLLLHDGAQAVARRELAEVEAESAAYPLIWTHPPTHTTWHALL